MTRALEATTREHHVSPKPAKKRRTRRTQDNIREAIAEKPRPLSERIVWGTGASLTGFLDRAGLRFAVVIQHVSGWTVLGLVTKIPEWGLGDSQAIGGVLQHHAHEMLGSFPDLDGEQGAMQAARRFLLEAPAPTDLCGCGDVGFATGATPAGPDP